MKRLLTVLLPVILFVGCGSATSGTSPSPLVNTATLTISTFKVTNPQPGAQAGTFNYTATLHVVEAGTVGLTFTHLVFTALPSGGIGAGTPGAFIAAGGTQDLAYPLLGFPPSTQIKVDITFIDDHGLTGSATATADVPAE